MIVQFAKKYYSTWLTILLMFLLLHVADLSSVINYTTKYGVDFFALFNDNLIDTASWLNSVNSFFDSWTIESWHWYSFLNLFNYGLRFSAEIGVFLVNIFNTLWSFINVFFNLGV